MVQPDHPLPPPPPATAPEAVPPDQLLHDVIVSTPQRPRRADGIAIGTLVGFAQDGAALVDIATFEMQGARARSVAPLDSCHIGQSVALGFEAGDPAYPIILGVMLAQSPAVTSAADLDVTLDGETVTLTAEHQIELRCGEAAIILSSDGRVQIRGAYITSQASATQRILGGSVNIN